jgi:hypothetical protein
MRNKLPKLKCILYKYTFAEGWEAIWHPRESAGPRGAFTVTIMHHHEKGGDSHSYEYMGPPSRVSSEHLIRLSVKLKLLPK